MFVNYLKMSNAYVVIFVYDVDEYMGSRDILLGTLFRDGNYDALRKCIGILG